MKVVPSGDAPDTQVREYSQPVLRPAVDGASEKRRASVTSYAGLSTRLLLLNGLAIIAVVVNHASAWAFVSSSFVLKNWTARNMLDFMGPMTYYSLRALEQLIIFAIPAFLFISGYFISFAIGRIEANKQWRIIFARIKNLVIPFLIWSVLILLLDIILGNPYTVQEFIKTILTGKVRAPYYFVPLLVQYLILSPFLVFLAKKDYKLLLMMTAVIQFVTIGLRYDTLLGLNMPALQPILWLNDPHLFASRIFYFTLGIVFGLHYSQFKQMLMSVRWGLLVSLVVFFILGIVEWEFLQRFSTRWFIGQTDTIIDIFYALAFIFSFLAFEEFSLPFSKQIGILGAMSFGIYLLHFSVEEYVSKIIFHFAPWLINFQLLMQPILIVCGIGIPVIMMTLVKRSPIKQYYRFLFG
jgi:probable poly-beta-1,6-N-acetyl-D-glucosamine export protein